MATVFCVAAGKYAFGCLENADNLHPVHVWFESVRPVGPCMGMPTLKEVMGFAVVLLLTTVITGVIWTVDHWVLQTPEREPNRYSPRWQGAFPCSCNCFLLRSFLYELFKIPSESMLPTFLRAGTLSWSTSSCMACVFPVLEMRRLPG